MKVDPIIAVKDVEKSSTWYQNVFECISNHGGSEFEILTNKEGEVQLCLHKWNTHDHPTMQLPSNSPGNGFILYFRVDDLHNIWKNVTRINHPVENEIALNPNSRKEEFSIRDPDGYFIIVSEFHNYGRF